jgi:hypothetical protein
MSVAGARGRRFVLYGLALGLAVALDRLTPLGVADWMAEASIVWLASVWGSAGEMRAVAGVGSAAMLFGLWNSPNPYIPVWIDVVNRVMAIGIIWIVVHTASSRLIAQEVARKTTAQLKVLQGLLPICACCKAIRTQTGDWRKLESYLSENSEVIFTHTYCPPCAAKLYPKAASEPQR